MEWCVKQEVQEGDEKIKKIYATLRRELENRGMEKYWTGNQGS